MSAHTAAMQVASFALAPLMLGVINKTKAIFAGRDGAPLLQPYYDLWKLLQKGAVYSATTTWVFRAGPIICLAAVAVALLLLPFGRAAGFLDFDGDLLVLVGLLALARFMIVLAALDTGSAFEGMGASREVTFSAMAEVAFFFGLAALVIISGSLSLSGIMGEGVASHWNGSAGLALGLVALALFLVLLAENSRIPVDDPNTHLELTMVHEVMVLDHSGPDFGYILYASALKFWLFAALIVGLVLPFRTGSPLGDSVVFLAGILAVALAVGVVESSMARLRMIYVPHLLLGAAVLAAMSVTLALAIR